MAKTLTLLTLLTTALSLRGETVEFLTVPKVGRAPGMTGDLSDPIWRKGATIALDDVVGKRAGEPVTTPTTVRILRDAEALYFGFDCVHPDSPHLNAKERERDLPAWADESVEIFIDRNDFSDYYHFTINAVGSIYDGRKFNSSWNGDWQCVAKTVDGRWSAEVKIPFASIAGPPQEGAHWLLNVCRNAHLKDGNVENSAWAFPGHHRPVGLLCFGPIAPQPLVESTRAAFREFAKVASYLPSAKRDELAALRASFQELKRGSSEAVEPKRYAAMLTSARDISRRLRPLREIALMRLILEDENDDEEESASPAAQVTGTGAFVAPNWRIEPNDEDLFALTCLKKGPKTGRFEEFCVLRFACIEHFSSNKSRRFHRVFRVPDQQTQCLNELCHAYTVSQPKEIGRWVARRIQAIGDGVVIELLNRCGPAVGNDIKLSKDGCSMGLSVDSATSKPGDTYLVNDERHQYPLLPPSSTRERAKHPAAPGARLVSNADPAKAFTLQCLREAISLGVCSRMDSRSNSSVSVGFGVCHSIAAFFSPAVSTAPPLPKVGSANWIATAIERTLASEAGEKLQIWRREIDGLLRLAKDQDAPIDTPEITGARREFNVAVERFDFVRGKMDGSPEAATLEGWIRLGATVQQIKEAKIKLARALAMVVAPY